MEGEQSRYCKRAAMVYTRAIRCIIGKPMSPALPSFHNGKQGPLAWLALSLAVHLLAIRLWPQAPVQVALPVLPPIEVHLKTMPVPERKLSPSEAIPARVPQPVRQTPQERAPNETSTPSAAPAIEAAPEPASRNSDQLILDAKRSIGKIDRELRREFPAGVQPSAPSKLERGIAAAARPDRPGMAEKLLPDGRKITKVSGPGGTYCVIESTVGTPGGVDQLQRGVQQRTTSCDKLFD